MLLPELLSLLEEVKDLLVVLVESSHAVQLALVGTQEIFTELIWTWDSACIIERRDVELRLSTLNPQKKAQRSFAAKVFRYICVSAPMIHTARECVSGAPPVKAALNSLLCRGPYIHWSQTTWSSSLVASQNFCMCCFLSSFRRLISSHNCHDRVRLGKMKTNSNTHDFIEGTVYGLWLNPQNCCRRLHSLAWAH